MERVAASTLQDMVRPTNWPRMRPRFIVEVNCSADHVMETFRGGDVDNPRSLEGSFSERHGVITVPEEARQFWSTQCGLTIEDARTDASGETRPTRILGVFSPHPEIWTAYVFTIGVLSLIVLMGLMYAVVELTMGHAPWALVASLLAVLIGGIVYTSTLVGQGLALGEMYELRSYVANCLAAAEASAVREPGSAGESAQL